jgi:hypothetical protein
MAKHWYVETSADRASVLAACHELFFIRPSISERAKFWSKGAQFRSMLVWKESHANGADLAAAVVSGGMREALSASRNGPGSMLGTTIAVKVENVGETRRVQLWLAEYPTFVGIATQGDVLKSYAKQLASKLVARGVAAEAHK